MQTHERGVIVPGTELFRDGPGYNPLDLVGDAPRRDTAPLQFLVVTTQEDWRGGHMAVTEFVPPAPDVAMHFHQPITSTKEGIRYGIASLLATSSLAATVTYNESPALPPRSGSYFDTISPKRSTRYKLHDSQLALGKPLLHAAAYPLAYMLADRTDTDHAADAFRVVDTPDQLGEIADRFGWALGLNRADRDTFAALITNHAHDMRTYRRMQSLGEAAVALRSDDKK
jgi:hypothetical protein